MLPPLAHLHKAIAALVAVALHGAIAAGAWSLSRGEIQAPKLPDSFEVVELPSSAAVIEPLTPTPKPEPEPETVPEPQPQPIIAPEDQPEPRPLPAPKPLPREETKAKAETKPKAVAQPRAALVQQAEAIAPSPAYVAPRQHAAYLDNPKPAYPTMARKRGMEGRVILRVQVNRDGAVKAVDVEQSTGFAMLDQAARTAVLRWRFAPAMQGNTAVDGEVLVPFDFRLTSG